MTDLETPWATPDGVPGEAQWFGEGPFTQAGEGLVDESWADEAPAVETRTGERWQESPFETPVEGFLEQGTTGQWESFADSAVGVTTETEGVPGCGGPVSGTPPLIYRTSWALRSRTPWVGRAQTLLNVFLAQQRAGTESCTDQSAATRAYIASLRARLAPLGQDPLGVDCIFGEGTEVATLMFQACRGLLRDGKIGDLTWPDLLALETAPPVPPPTPTPSPARPPRPAPDTGVRMREDAWTLSATGTWPATLLWYARAVGALKTRTDPADPRSWIHLANIHGTSDLPRTWPRGAPWNQCEHFSWYFLPWHRVYVHHVEKIIRSEIVRLGGPADWAMPYWNYSDTSRPDVLKLPPAFRATTLPDGSRNPLCVDERRPGLNGGDPISTDVTVTAMRAQHSFEPSGRVGGSFGGSAAPLGSHAGGGGSSGGALEDTIHGNVHVAVGGDGATAGFMSSFERAAQDPIFWLHHSNIDRLWELWRRDVRHRDTRNAVWRRGHWTMAKGTADETSLATADVVDTRRAPLLYQYADTSPRTSQEMEDEWVGDEVHGGPDTDAMPPELVGASEGETPLGARPTTTRVRLLQPSGPSARRFAEGEGVPSGATVHLRLENVTATVVHTSAVVVYLNLPPGGRPADFPDRRVGTLPMFGVVETSRRDANHGGAGRTLTFDITRIARALATSRQWDPQRVDVTFVPIPDARGRVGDGDVKVGRISVFYA